MTDCDDFNQKLNKHRAVVAKANALNKTAVFDALAAAGITDVVVGFDGEGDSGQIESVAARSGETYRELPTTAVTLASTQWGADDITTRKMPLNEAVEELCYGYPEQEHGGWPKPPECWITRSPRRKEACHERRTLHRDRRQALSLA